MPVRATCPTDQHEGPHTVIGRMEQRGRTGRVVQCAAGLHEFTVWDDGTVDDVFASPVSERPAASAPEPGLVAVPQSSGVQACRAAMVNDQNSMPMTSPGHAAMERAVGYLDHYLGDPR